MSEGWRSIIASNVRNISLDGGFVSVSAENGEKYSIPCDQLESVYIDSSICGISSAALVEMCSNGGSVTMCNNSHQPAILVSSLNRHHESAGILMDQISWKQSSLDNAWADIVRHKIQNQRLLLENLGLSGSVTMTEYENGVMPGDENNREALASKLYFRSLFGAGFHRFSSDNVNRALNYGYVILQNSFTRILVSHGYHTELGIHHRGRDNSFNLSCDLMEPFRPAIDRVVWYHGDVELDWEYKKVLQALNNEIVPFHGEMVRFADAQERYVLAILNRIKEENDTVY